MPIQPMAEVFGYQIDDFSPEAQRHRQHRLCPFNNKVPSCTKDKASDPLGVCSVYAGSNVTYDDQGTLTGFGALEVQAVYISGNIRRPFHAYMADPQANAHMDWRGKSGYPRADFLSSSRKRIAPQLIYNGGTLRDWQRKMAVAVDKAFFAELPSLPQVARQDADVVWLVYDLIEDPQTRRHQLTRVQTIYTQFTSALLRITNQSQDRRNRF